jgi:tetratricopeptide (TPR) repeat protein
VSLERAARALALCDESHEVQTVVAELERRFPDATLTRRVSLPVVAAIGAIRHGEWSRALDILEPVRPYDHAPWSEFWPAYLRGEAHLGLKRGREAAADFTAILEHRGEAPISQLYPLARLGLARAHAAAGDPDKARDAYDEFLESWREADDTLPLLRAVRQERARLPHANPSTTTGAN